MSGPAVIAVKIGDHSYTLTFKFGTMRLVEAELGGSLFEIMASGTLGMNDLSAIFWAALQPKHRMNREASDELIDAVGVEQVGAWIAEGLAKYFGKGDVPEGDAGGDEGKAEAPAAKPRSRRKATS